MRTGKVICTARGTHKPRVLGAYNVEDDGFFTLTSKQPVIGGQGTTYYDPATNAGVSRLRVRCPSCRSDFQFTAETISQFLRMDLPSGATRRDLSRLEASI